MITADQLTAHAIGDYILQSDWMAAEKTRRWSVALFHGFTYSLVFLAFRPSPAAWLTIFLTHAIIDRYRLARYVVWAKNWLGPRHANLKWVYCQKTGYPPDRPDWIAVWLMIAADNIIHVCINGAALRWLQ